MSENEPSQAAMEAAIAMYQDSGSNLYFIFGGVELVGESDQNAHIALIRAVAHKLDAFAAKAVAGGTGAVLDGTPRFDAPPVTNCICTTPNDAQLCAELRYGEGDEECTCSCHDKWDAWARGEDEE